MGLILLLQLALPLLLIAWLWLRPPASPLLLLVQVVATGSYILAIHVAGLWLQLPRWLTFLYALLLAGGLLLALRRRGAARGSIGAGGWAALLLLAGLGLYAIVIVAAALAGRAPPPGRIVELAPPLRGPGIVVAHGGSTGTINGHLKTLDSGTERFRAWRGQSHAVDFARVGRAGRAAPGLEPRDPRAYAIFGDPVFAPCPGRVVALREDRPDMPVPVMDRSFLLGNHLILDCGGVHVVLAHFRRGGIDVEPGQRVRAGERLGEVGNSGNSSQPHLHIHAQTPGTAAAPIGGDPLPIRIGGRYLVRNDRL